MMIATILLSVVALWAIASLAISIYVGWNLTHKPRLPITKFPTDYGMVYKDIAFSSRDSKTVLKGWVIPPDGAAKLTVIFSHGYGGNRYEDNVDFLPLSTYLVNAGYRVVMFDFRGSGESGGTMTTVSAKEKLDLLGAIDWVKANFKEPVALYGISMGASTSLLAGSASEDVAGIIADSPFSDLKDYLSENMSFWTKLPRYPYTPLILFMIPLISRLQIKDASPISEIGNFYPRPVLFIHSSSDESIPHPESLKMVSLHPDKFELWTPADSEHVKAFQDHPADYVQKVLGFLDKLAAD